MQTEAKSGLMLRIEREQGEPLEDVLARLVPTLGHVETAKKLGVATASIGYWMTRLGMRSVTVILKPGQTVEIKKEE